MIGEFEANNEQKLRFKQQSTVNLDFSNTRFFEIPNNSNQKSFEGKIVVFYLTIRLLALNEGE